MIGKTPGNKLTISVIGMGIVGKATVEMFKKLGYIVNEVSNS